MFRILAVVLLACATVALGCTSITIASAKYQLSMISGNTNCAASILNEKFAITSAYCVKVSGGVGAMKLVSGSNFYLVPPTTHYVKMATIHPSYNPTNFDYDLAILLVSPYFTFGATVGAIGLPAQSQPTAIGTTAFVTGWSTTCGAPAAILQGVKLLVSGCAPYTAYTTPRKICVGTPVTPFLPCQGDRGGPMAVNNQLIGVRSFNPAAYCATSGLPAMFIKVSMARTWIDATMAAMG